MQELFLELVKLSLIGSLFALAVMAVRLIFRKAPKWIFCVLWGIVALRLIVPISIESDLSLIPDRLASGQIITNVGSDYIGDVVIIYESNAGYSNAVEAGRQPIYSNDGYYVVTEKDSLEAPKTVGEAIYPVLSWLWFAGMVLMLIYTAVSYILLKIKMEESTLLRDNIWQCEQADSPFVLGIIRPRIYLPYSITKSDMENVIAHEQAHIRRKDHWWKPIGFLLLSIHWFNPVMWLAYILLCRDIEAACDEKVIKHMEKDEMRAYSTALLHCSVHRHRIAACPLAFGEVGVKERIKHVMNYKKPVFWIIILTLAVCLAVSVCFLTNPTGFKFSETNGVIVSASYFDKRGGEEGSTELNLAQISELTSRLEGVKNTRKSDEYGGLTPGYQISALLQDGSYIRISGYSLSDIEKVDIEWNDNRYVVTDKDFQEYLSRICSGDDSTISSVGGVDGPSNETTTKTMTLDDVFDLAAKGDELTWEDLKGFTGRDIGSGLYVIRYDIDSDFYLLVGDGELTGTPMYAMLCCVSGDQHVDILTGDVKGFIDTYRPSALDCAISDAIAEHYRSTEPDGLIHTQSYVLIGNEIVSATPLQGQDNHFQEVTVYLLVRAKTYSVSDNELSPLAGGVLIPTMIRFSVDTAESYKMEEYWTPTVAGHTNSEFNKDEVFEKFPENVAEEALALDKYHAQLNQICDSKALAYLSKIESNNNQSLEVKYPEYFQLSTDKGLEVYVYQMAAKSYSCVLVSGRNAAYTWDELLGKPSTTLDEMRQIVQSYRLDRSMISIIPIQMPHSSYWYEIDDAYRTKLEGLFWAEYQDAQKPFTGIIDSVSFDIDGDGKQEMCTLGYGPTSGLFSFTFIASPMEVTASNPKYSEVFVLGGAYKLSFEITDGVLRIRGDKTQPSEETVYFDIAIKDGHILLQCEEEGIIFE